MISPASDVPGRRPVAVGLVLLGIVVLSFNLRPAAVSVGPLLAEIRAAVGLTSAGAGLLTSLPVLAFSGFGALTPRIARLVGLHRTTLLATLAVTLGLTGRVLLPWPVPFLLCSALALAGMAAANVLLPSLVKLHFPQRIGRVTAIYTTAMAIGLTGALLLTVPIADALGSWRWGLGVWAVLGLVAAIPWLRLARQDVHRAPDSGQRAITVSQVARTRLGLAMAAFFGLQSMQAYIAFGWFPQVWRDAGYSAAAASALVALLAGVSIPLSFVIPSLAARRADQRTLGFALLACYPLGFVLLLLDPYLLAVPAALLLGTGGCVFSLALTLFGLRARTAEGTAALSSFVQAGGYLIAGLGPFGFGWLHGATDGWRVPLLVLLAVVGPMALLMGYIGRPTTIEDQVGAP